MAKTKKSASPATESYLVLARKYRPEVFEDIVGQDVISRTLQNAVRTGRVHHAYLFAGPRGVGKTTMARILAKALNCESSDGPTPTPCCKCDACLKIGAGMDVDILEIDGASNTGVDHIRELRQNARYAPSQRRFKIYYIDEVHMLSKAAFNALLKTLEEPPPRVKFIFSTTDPQMIPETVVSRCQRFDFRRISAADIVGCLKGICEKEGLKPEPGVLEMIARSVRGGLRDALGVLDQVAVFGEEQLTVEQVQFVTGAVSQDVVEKLVDALSASDAGGALEVCHRILYDGADVVDFCNQLSEYLRDLMVARFCGLDSAALSGSFAPADALKRQSELFEPDALLYMIQLLREAKLRARRDSVGRVALEAAIVKMAQIDRLIAVSEAIGRIGGGGSDPVPARGQPKPDPGYNRPGTKAGPPEQQPSGVAETAADMSAHFARIKGSLDPAKAGPASHEKTVPIQPPEGIDATLFRQLKSCSVSPSVSEKLAQDANLLKLFAQAHKALGLEPLNVDEHKPVDSDSESSFLGE